MQVGFVLKEIHMAPRARQAVVERLRRRTASRASVNGGAKPDLKIDPSGLWLEDDLSYLPRSNETQSLGEQRFNHEEPVARGKAAIVLHAEGGRLPSSARSKRKRAGSDVKGSAAPGLRPPLTSPPPQAAKTSARSTGNDIEPGEVAMESVALLFRWSAALLLLALLAGCTVLQPIPPLRNDLYFPSKPRSMAPDSCSQSGADETSCLVPAVPLEGYFGDLGREIWSVDLERRKYAAMAAEKTNLASLYNAMLWPTGAYLVGRSAITSLPTSVLIGVSSFLTATYGVLGSGIPDRDKLYIEASIRLTCAIALATVDLYAKPDILDGYDEYDELRTLMPGTPSLSDVRQELTEARKAYTAPFNSLVAELQSRTARAPAYKPIDVEVRFNKLRGNTGAAGNTGASGANTIERFTENGLKRQEKAQDLLEKITSLYSKLRQEVRNTLRDRANSVRVRLDQALIARAPALSAPGMTVNQVSALINSVPPSGDPGTLKGRAKAQAGADTWVLTARMLAGLTKESAQKLKAFNGSEQANLDQAIEKVEKWLNQRKEMVRDRRARIAAAHLSCDESMFEYKDAKTGQNGDG